MQSWITIAEKKVRTLQNIIADLCIINRIVVKNARTTNTAIEKPVVDAQLYTETFIKFVVVVISSGAYLGALDISLKQFIADLWIPK